MTAVFRYLINTIVLIIVVSVIYIFGLFFQFIPLEYTPQVLFKTQFQELKIKLSQSSVGRNLYYMLDNMEKAYAPKPTAQDGSTTTNVPQTPGTDASSNAQPSNGQPSPQQPATTQPQEKDAITRAREAAQQYNEAVEKQQKALDNL